MSSVVVDPRVERSRRVILEATLDELSDAGYGALTIEGVARRANVGKATVYRHWSGKPDLVSDAMSTLRQMVEPPDTDNHRERITGLITQLAEHLATSRFSACLPALIAASEIDDAVRTFHLHTSEERLASTVGVLDDARDAGRLDPDVDTRLLAEMLVGPIFFRRLMTRDPFDPADVDRLVGAVLDPHWH